MYYFSVFSVDFTFSNSINTRQTHNYKAFWCKTYQQINWNRTHNQFYQPYVRKIHVCSEKCNSSLPPLKHIHPWSKICTILGRMITWWNICRRLIVGINKETNKKWQNDICMQSLHEIRKINSTSFKWKHPSRLCSALDRPLCRGVSYAIRTWSPTHIIIIVRALFEAGLILLSSAQTCSAGSIQGWEEIEEILYVYGREILMCKVKVNIQSLIPASFSHWSANVV